jgi:peptide/nickel transport system permease protein
MVGKGADQKEIDALRHELGLDKPLYQQYFFYLKQVCTFDFGRSYTTKQKISSMIKEGIGPSLSLSVPAFFFGSFLGICISLFVAFERGKIFDKTIVFLSVAGMSISFLAYIIAGQYYLAYIANIFPISGWEPGFRGIPFLVLPGLIWVVVSLGSDVRFFRTVMLDEINQDYVQTAYAKGLGKISVLFGHVLKNAMIPILTRLVIAIPFLYTGSLLLENFFSIPGLGSMSIDAINSSDFPVIKAITFIGALLYIIGNILTDICYALADPRIRLK